MRMVVGFATVTLLMTSCYRTKESDEVAAGADAGTESSDPFSDGDTDGDADADIDADTDADEDTDTGVTTEGGGIPCEQPSDCPGIGEPVCCGCVEEYTCFEGQCVETDFTCYDSACCGSPFPCDVDCSPHSPYPDYSGRCGEVDCDSVLLGWGYDPYVYGCCAKWDGAPEGAEAMACGVDISVVGLFSANPGICVPLEQPGEPDDDCPMDDENPTTGTLRPGCCTSTGLCGIIRDDLGLGCAALGIEKVIACGGDTARDGGTDASPDAGLGADPGNLGLPLSW